MVNAQSCLVVYSLLHSLVSSLRDFWELGHYGVHDSFLDFSMLGTRTLCKGGVMICWLGRWDAV